MADKVLEDLEALRHQVQALSLLVEWLFDAKFSRGPQAVTRFRAFSQHILSEVNNLTVPGAPAVGVDHASQGWREQLEPILERIEARLRQSQDRASGG